MADEIVIDINRFYAKEKNINIENNIDNNIGNSKIGNMLISALHSFLPVDPPSSNPDSDKLVISNIKKEWSKAINMIFEESLAKFN
jgi:hypothetical protein